MSNEINEKRMSEHIKVVYYDDDPIVYRDDKILTEKEIVNLLVEFFEDCDTLTNENEKLKKEIKQTKKDFEQGLSVFEDIANANHQHFKLKVFNLIDNKIKLLNDCYMINEAKILNDLKEELLK